MDILETLKAKILKLSLEYKDIRDSFKNINQGAKSEAIFIAFPDYKIETPFGYFSGLGHAGVLLIDPKGKTIYYEYGRYDKEQLGLVKVLEKPISHVVIGNDGLATKESLKIVLKKISTQAGKKGRIEAIYFKQTNFEKMNAYAQKRMKQNKDAKRDPYELTSNNCGTFAQDVIRQSPNSNTLSESEMPYIQSPVNLVKELDKKHQRIDYNPKDNKLQIEDEK